MLAMSNLGFDIQNNDEGSASLLKIPYFIFPSMELFDIITKTLENPSEILVQSLSLLCLTWQMCHAGWLSSMVMLCL